MTRHADGVIMRAGNRLVNAVRWEKWTIVCSCRTLATAKRLQMKRMQTKNVKLNCEICRQRLFLVGLYWTPECADDERKKKSIETRENEFHRQPLKYLSPIIDADAESDRTNNICENFPRLHENYARSSESISLFNWLIKI